MADSDSDVSVLLEGSDSESSIVRSILEQASKLPAHNVYRAAILAVADADSKDEQDERDEPLVTYLEESVYFHHNHQ
jgi:hypothetical protein